jgi:hypothetical protein
MSNAVLEDSRDELAVGPALPVGWTMGSETPVLNMVKGTAPRAGEVLMTETAPDELLSGRLLHAVNALVERESERVTGVAAARGADEIIPSIARSGRLSVIPKPVEGSLTHLLRGWLQPVQTDAAEGIVKLFLVDLRRRERVNLKLSPLKAAHALKQWLGLSWAQLATVAGLNEGTIHYWQRNPAASPRPGTVATPL